MLWTRIGLEPCEPQLLKRGGRWFAYDLCLPLINDGRIAMTHLMKEPEQATARRFDANGDVLDGRVRSIDGQWSMVWDAPQRPSPIVVRFFGRRFLEGDRIAVRPPNSVIAFYQVCQGDRAGELIEGLRA